jgi:sirohydrochlorin ferrochelatase
MQPSDKTQTGIVIVDHGSKRGQSNDMLVAFVDLFDRHSPYEIVEPAHMELAEPSIPTAFDRCVERGATRVVVSPYFLLPGRHWHEDIPSLTAAAARKHPGVSYIVTAPLGLHPMMAQVVASRIEHCLAHVAGDAPECDVCVGTGRCQMVQA